MKLNRAKGWPQNYKAILVSSCLFFSCVIHAESDRTNYDVDNDGLIEINDLDDLNEIRNDLSGKTLYGANDGCPETGGGCVGFELTTTLDFNTSPDDAIDENDQFWNEGLGWLPIGSFAGEDDNNPFRAQFQGNGHKILNLFINRPNHENVGLFGYIAQGAVSELELSGPLMAITGSDQTGSLAGLVSQSLIIQCSSSGVITGSHFTGGLVGVLRNSNVVESSADGAIIGVNNVGGLVAWASESSIKGSQFKGTVTGSQFVGGLAGAVRDNSFVHSSLSVGAVTGEDHTIGGLVGWLGGSQIQASFATGAVSGDQIVGGLVGRGVGVDDITARIQASFATGLVIAELQHGGLLGSGETTVVASYWAADTSSLSTSTNSEEKFGVDLVQLQCPVIASNDQCVEAVVLFDGWDAIQNDQQQTVWDFGTVQQIPGLKINGQVFRDTDGDGSLDADDDRPFDTDGDGINNDQDKFPANSEASVDTDNDGKPDDWHDTCDTVCQSQSTLTIDNDDDNDQVADELDAFPLLYQASKDDDDDGLVDEWHEPCDDQCQADSQLTLDEYPGDHDNDGVIDEDDDDLNTDSGAPIISGIPPEVNLFSTNETSQDGTMAQLLADDSFVSAFQATDAWDETLEFEASLNGQVLTQEDNLVTIPVGRHSVSWVAIDDANNRSDEAMVVMNVYPQVRFSQNTSTVGEPGIAEIEVELTGPSPKYPVVIQVETLFDENNQTALTQDDLDANAALPVDLTQLALITIERGENNEPNKKSSFQIPTAEDNVKEGNETLLFELISAKYLEQSDDQPPIITDRILTLSSNQKQHTLTVTEINLAPEVTIEVLQKGEIVDEVDIKHGDVVLRVLITDPNGQDQHQVEWDLSTLNRDNLFDANISLDPQDWLLEPLNISVKVTDDGLTPITTNAEIVISIVDVPDPEEPRDGSENGSGGSSGGGGSTEGGLLLLLSFLLFRRINWRKS